MTISRRTFLLTAASAMTLVPLTATRAASMTRTTVIYAPHPDDETLRLTGYITFAHSRGDHIIVVAVTDGEGTGTKKTLGLTTRAIEGIRRNEQTLAVSYLTHSGAEIIRLGISDGGVRANKAEISQIVRDLESTYGPDVEHYCACRLDDVHDDHRAVAEAVKESGARVVRYSRPPGTTGGTKYLPPSGYEWEATEAMQAYHGVGFASVRSLFIALRDSGYASYITP